MSVLLKLPDNVLQYVLNPYLALADFLDDVPKFEILLASINYNFKFNIVPHLSVNHCFNHNILTCKNTYLDERLIKCITYRVNGSTKSIHNYKLERLNGKSYTFYKNGTLIIKMVHLWKN